MVKIGNIYYFMFVFIAFTYFLLLYFLLRKRDKEKQYKVLLIILFGNLLLHFGKLLFEPYRSDFPFSIRKVTFENICAVSTLVFPFVLLYRKNTLLNNYMYFIGLLGGLGAMLYPTEAFNKNPLTFDVIRFYICHINLWVIPLLLVIFKIYTLDFKKALFIPIIFIAIECLILINEIILIKVGFVGSNLSEFLDRDIRNSSFIFGPLSSFDKVKGVITCFTPSIFTKDIFNINNGIDFYWPVIWLVIPAIIYIPIVFIIITLPFTYKDIKSFILKLSQK